MKYAAHAACTLAAATLLLLAWPGSARIPEVSPMAWTQRPPLTVDCRAQVVVTGVLADPDRVSDRDGEALELRNLEPEPIDLQGWTVHVGRASRRLDGTVLAAGERRAVVGAELRPLRLANRGGVARLRDPCGREHALRWPEAEPGRWLVAPEEALDGLGPWR